MFRHYPSPTKPTLYARINAYLPETEQWNYDMFTAPQPHILRSELYHGYEYSIVVYHAVGSHMPFELYVAFCAMTIMVKKDYGLVFNQPGISDGLDKPGEVPFGNGDEFYDVPLQ